MSDQQLPEDVLEEYGIIRWQRTLKLLRGFYKEHANRQTGFPEVEGIDLRELLNDGWQIRTWRDVPVGWLVAYADGGGVVFSTITGNPARYASILVFCRPWEGDES